MSLTRRTAASFVLAGAVGLSGCMGVDSQIQGPSAPREPVGQEAPVRQPTQPESILRLPGFSCYFIKDGRVVPVESAKPGYVCMAPFNVEEKALSLINPLKQKTGLSNSDLLYAVDNGDFVVTYKEFKDFEDPSKISKK